MRQKHSIMLLSFLFAMTQNAVTTPHMNTQKSFEILLDIFCQQRCDKAYNVKSALKFLINETYDIIIVDYWLGNTTCKPILEYIAKPWNVRRPIIILVIASIKSINLDSDMVIDYTFEKPFSEENIDKMLNIIKEIKNREKL